MRDHLDFFDYLQWESKTENYRDIKVIENYEIISKLNKSKTSKGEADKGWPLVDWQPMHWELFLSFEAKK